MSFNDHWRAAGRNPAVRILLLGLGLVLILITPFIAIFPGPGGFLTFGAGAALVLRYSAWAKRFYVRLQRRFPKSIAWSDWALRRASARRREAIRKQRKALCEPCR
jgi:hypothetical protein